jgi:hypothetical protein
MKRTMTVIALAVVATGCASSPVKVSESHPVPADRLLPGLSAFAQPSDTTAKIIVIRDSGFIGGGARTKLLIDGVPVAKLRTGERVQCFVKAGDHILGVTPEPNLGAADAEIQSIVAAGRTYHFRISVTASSTLRIQPTMNF